jgi:ABC-type bacteriocin/lantibiotic exporter with double-glycine peptidase domain
MAAASIRTPAGPKGVPFILQNEPSECALACLAMIAAAWGLKADMAAFAASISAL